MITPASLRDRFVESEFLRNNAVYLLAAVAVGALNYLYYPVLGRLLEPSAFGEIQTLVSIFLQATAYLTVMGLVTVHIVANNKGSRMGNRLVSELERLSIAISGVLLIGTIVFGNQLKSYFQFDSIIPFVFLGIAILISVPYMIRSAYVNGKRLFSLNAVSSILAAGSKLALSAALVLIGFNTAGAVFGIILAQCIALVVASRFAKQHGFMDKPGRGLFKAPDMRLLSPELKYAGLVLVGSLSITILYSVDIIVAKHYLDPHTAGLYASIATVARILFFLTVPISQVLMPSVQLDADQDENKKTLMKSAGLLGGIGLVMVLAFALMPEFIVGVLMGGAYSEYAYLLPRLGLAMFIISLLNLFITYFMALRVYSVGIIAVLGVTITYTWMHMSHASPAAIANSLLYGSVVFLALFLAWALMRANASTPSHTETQAEAYDHHAVKFMRQKEING